MYKLRELYHTTSIRELYHTTSIRELYHTISIIPFIDVIFSNENEDH